VYIHVLYIWCILLLVCDVIYSSVSLLCDLDQCILCDDYPANLMLTDRMELVGVAENDSLER